MSSLTPRQLEMLVLAANGNTSVQIARTCYVSPHTVHKTMWDVRDRMGAKTTGQAILKAIAHNLISLDGDGVATPEPTLSAALPAVP